MKPQNLLSRLRARTARKHAKNSSRTPSNDSNRQKRSRRNQVRTAFFESLESRYLMATDVYVQGTTSGQDTMEVSVSGGNLIITGTDSGTQTFVLSDVGSLTIDGLARNDVVRLKSSFTLPAGKDLSITAEEIYVADGISIQANNISLHSVGSEVALTVASNLPIDVSDLFASDRIIEIGDGVSLTGNVIDIHAERVANVYSPARFFGIGKKDAKVNIGDATIVGNSVNIQADAKDLNVDNFLPAFASSFGNDGIQALYGKLGLPIPVSVMIRKSESTVQLDSTEITATGAVVIDATSATDSTTSALSGTALGSSGPLTAGLSMATTSAQTLLTGTTSITAGGSVSITSSGDNRASQKSGTTVSGPDMTKPSVDLKQFGGAIAVSISNSTVRTEVGSQVEITSTAGNVDVKANGKVYQKADASVSLHEDGSGGLSVSVAIENAVVEAIVDGKITAAGLDTAMPLTASSLTSPVTTLNMPGHGLKTGERLFYMASKPDGSTPTTLDNLLSGQELYVVALDADHIQLVLEPAVDLSLDAFGPFDPNAANPLHSLTGMGYASFDSSSAVNLAANTITISSADVPNLNQLTNGMEVVYLTATDTENVDPIEIGGLKGARRYIVKNVTAVPASSPAAITLQLADPASPNSILDLSTAGVGGDHFLQFQGSSASFIPNDDDANNDSTHNDPVVNVDSDQITIPGHGWQTGDEVVYRVDPTKVIHQPVTKSIMWIEAFDISLNPNEVSEAGQINVDIQNNILFNVDLSSLPTGTRVRYIADPAGSAITGLNNNQVFWVIQYDDGSAGLASSYANAVAGSRVNLTGTGTGTNHRFVVQVVDDSTDTISVPNHGLVTGQRVTYVSGQVAGTLTIGADSAGLQDGASYYVIVRDDHTLSLADSDDDAFAGNARSLSATFSNNENQRFETPKVAIDFDATRSDYVVDPVANKLFLPGLGLAKYTKVIYQTGGGSPIGSLVDGHEYYIDFSNADPDHIQLTTNPLVMNPGGATIVYESLTRTATTPNGDHAFTTIPGDVDINSDTIRLPNHGLAEGDLIRYSNNGSSTSIGGLTLGQTYEAVRVDGDHIQLRTVTASGGTPAAARDLTAAANPEVLHALEALDHDSPSTVLRTISFTPARVATTSTLINFDPTAQPTINTASVNPGTNPLGESIRLVGHGFTTGQTVTYLANGQTQSVGGLTPGDSYKVIVVDADHFRLTDLSDLDINLTSAAIGGQHSFEIDRIAQVSDKPIGGLENEQVYYVIRIDANTIRLSETREGATEASPIALHASTVDTTDHRLLQESRTNGISVISFLDAKDAANSSAEIHPKGKTALVIDRVKNYFKKSNSSVANSKASQFKGQKGAADLFSVSGGFSYNQASHDVTTRIGSTAELEAQTDINVRASIKNKVSSRAFGMTQSGRPVASRANAPQRKFSAGVAIAMGDYTNNANALVSSGAKLDAKNHIDVSSQVDYPFFRGDITLKNIINTLTGDRDYKTTGKELIATIIVIKDILNGGAVTQAVPATELDDPAKIAVTGGLVLTKYDTVAHAIIGENAMINQKAAFQTSTQSVNVEAYSRNRIVETAGRLDPSAPFESTSQILATNQAGELGVGGSFVISTSNIDTRAVIQRGASVRTGSSQTLRVAATENTIVLIGALQGSTSGGAGLSGSLDLIEHNSTTISQIEDGVTISAGEISVTANSDQHRLNIAGGFSKAKSVGAGVSVSKVTGSRITQAVVGDNPDVTTDISNLTSSIIAQKLTVNAENSGFLMAFGIAGASVSNTKADAVASAATPGVGGGASGVGPGTIAIRSGISIAGDATWIEQTGKIEAIVDIDGTLNVSGGDLSITALDDTFTVTASGAAALTRADNSGAALAGSFSRNIFDMQVNAVLRNTTVQNAHDVTVTATRDSALYSFSAAIGFTTLTAELRADRNFGGSVAGSVSWNTIEATTHAEIVNSPITASGFVTATTNDGTEILAIGGGIGITVGGTIGVGAGVGINEITNNTTTNVANSTITAGGDVTASSTAHNKIHGVGFSLGAGAFGVSGTVGINTIDGDTTTDVTSGTIESTTGSITVSASDSSEIRSDAGGVAIGVNLAKEPVPSSSYAVAAGAAVGINTIGVNGGRTVAARVTNGTLVADDAVSVTATNSPSITALTIAAAGALAQSSTATGIAAALAGAGSRNTIETTVIASATVNSQLKAIGIAGGGAAGGTVTLQAIDQSQIQVDAGGFAISVALSGNNRPAGAGALGVGIAVNEINGSVQSILDASTITADGNVSMIAGTELHGDDTSIDALAIAGSTSVGVSASKGAGVAIAGAAAAAFNNISRSIEAAVRQGSTITTTGSGNLSVLANDETNITSDTGGVSIAVGVSPGGGAGVGLAFGASVSVNSIGNDGAISTAGQVIASIDASTISVAGDMTVQATASSTIDTLAIAGTASVGGSSSAVAVSAAGAGAATYNLIRRKIQALVSTSSTVGVIGNAQVLALDSATIRANSIGASVAVSGSGSGTGFGASIGVSIAENRIDNAVKALIQSSAVNAGSLVVDSKALGRFITTLDQSAPLGVTPAQLDDATRQTSDHSSTPANEYTADQTDDQAILDRLYRLIYQLGTSAYPFGFTPELELQALATHGTTDSEDAQNETRLGSAWMLIDKALGKAFIINLESGALKVYESSIAALAVAASISVSGSGGSGLSLNGGGASTENSVTTKIDSQVIGSTITTLTSGGGTGDVQVSASSSAGIVSTVVAASLAIAASGGSGAGASIGAAIAKNEIGYVDATREGYGVHAQIDNSIVHAAGDVSLTAFSDARIGTTVIAASVAVSGASGTGIGLAGAGASAANTIAIDTVAELKNITSGNYTSEDLAISASDNASISSLAGAASLAIAAAGGSGAAIAIGVGLAKNVLDSETTTIINNVVLEKISSETVVVRPESGGVTELTKSFSYRDFAVDDISISSKSTGSINSIAFAASVAAGFGSGSALALSGAGAEATNQIGGSMKATIENSRIANNGNVALDANNSADIHSLIASVAVAVAGGGSGAIGAALGVALARNLIGYEHNGCSSVTYSSNSPRTIVINTSDTILIGSGPGAGDVYQYLGSSPLSDPTPTDPNSPNWLAHLDFNDSDLWRRVDLQSNPSGINAGLLNSSVVSSGALSADAVSTANIRATVISASAAITGGGDVGVSAAGAGTGVLNHISMDVLSYVNGDSNVVNAAATQPSYRGPDGVIIYTGNDAEITAVMPNSFATSFAGSGLPTIHVQSVDLTATDSSSISSVAGAVSLAAAVSGLVGGSIAVGASVAENRVDNTVHAFILNANDGIFTTGSSDVTTTPTTQTIDGQTVTLNNYTITTERDGNVALTANESANIASVSFAAALAASASLLAASLAGAGATALNVISNHVSTDVRDSNVSTFGELAQAADGTVVGVTTANLLLNSTNTSTIDSEVIAVSAAVAGSIVAGAGSIGVALAENRIGDSSAASGSNTHGTYATVSGSNVSTTGDTKLQATSSEQLRTVSAAGSIAVAVGVGAAGSATGTSSLAKISGDTHASIVNSTVVAGGDLTVDAISTAKVVEATAIGASVAIATGALSVAVTLVENTIDYDVKAWVTGSSSQHISSLGDISIEADATEASIKNVQGVTASLSAGLHTASAGGMSLINTIDNRIAASILGAISVDAGGNLSVKSNEASEIEADAAGVTVAISLGAAVGVATIENTISSQISTTIAGASLSGVDIDLLATSHAELTKTRTVGVAASLVGVTTNLAKAELKTKVASIVTSATIAASEDLTVQAKSNNYARAAADGGAIGAFAAGVMVAQIEQGGLVDGNNNPAPEVRAELGDQSIITASGVILEASSTDDLLASSISATGGIVAINGADARVTSDQSTLARIGASTNIVANAININSFADQNADSSADSLTIAAATGAGAATTNRVLGDTKIVIDDNAQLRSNVFTANAANSISKTGDIGSNNIRSGSIAAGALFVVTSDTDIGTSGNNATSTIDIQPDVKIEVGGNNAALGVMQLQATMRADAVDSVRLETASGYSLTTATSDLSSTTRANIDISGATLINRSGDIGIATQSDIGLRPSSNLFSAALNAAAGAAASAVSDIDNTITIDNSTLRGAEVRIQSGRDNFQVPNLMSNFADIEVTTVSLGPSIAVGVPKSEIDFTNFIDIANETSIEGYKDVLLISERNEEIPARADTDGLVLSLSGLPYGYPVSSAGEKVTRNAKVDVSANSNVTAGLYNQSVMLIRSVPIDGLDTDRLAITDPNLAGSDQDPGLFQASDYAFADSLGFELDPQVAYHYAPLKVDQIAIDITIDTIVHVVSGYSGGGVPGNYYKFRPLDARGNLRTDLETVPVVLQTQNYADRSSWLDIGTSLPPGYNPNGDDLPVYESNYTANFEQALNNKFYLIKNPDLPSPSLSYRNVGNMLIAQREQILSWMASHSNNQEAVARYQEQLNQVDQTLTELGLVTLEDMGNGQSKMIITEDLDAMFIQLPGVYAAPGSVFVEGYVSDVHLSGEVKAREGSSIAIHNASPFVPIVTDAIIRDNRRVAVVDQELRQFTPGNVFVNWQVQGTPVTGDGFGTGTITITHSPSNGNFDVAGIPANTLKDLYIEGSVVNENGTVNIANPIGTINVTGEVRGSAVTINAGKNFNLNTDDWLHTNRDPRQYINYFPLRQSVFNQAGTTRDRVFATATAVNIPTYRTVRFWGFTITVPVAGTSTLQDSINQSNSQIVAQGAISVTARYLNVNGLIQSGVQTITVGVSASFNPGRSTSTLTDAQNRPLAGISFGDPSDNVVDVPVSGYFDAANRSIVIHDVQPSGGRVTLVGELLSTGNGSIVAAYGHASLNIDNKSKYTLVMNEIDLTHDRVGEIILVDSNLQTKTTFTYADSGITKKHEKVNPSQPLLSGPRGEVSGLNYVEVGKKENATGTDLYYHPGADNQIIAAPNSGNLYYVWVEGQEKTKVEVRKYEKRSFNLFGDNAFGDLLVRDGSFKWETVNFRDAVPVLESEVVYSPALQGNGAPNSSDPLSYIVGNAYTIKYNQTPDRDVTLVPGQTIVHLKPGFPIERGEAGKYYRIKADVTTRLEVVLPDENYNDTTRWERFDSNPGSLQNTVESDYENYKQTVKRWTTGGGWLRKKTMHTEITTISGVTDYYTHSLRADYPIQIGFVGSSAATSTVQINSVTDIVLQGDVDVPLGSTVQVNSTGGDVIGASTVGFYGATPSLTVAGDVNINVETGLQPLTVHAGGKVYVDGITNATSNGGSGDGPTGNVITVQQIDAGGDVFINAADGIIAQDANSYVRGDHIELRTLRGDIGTSALPIKIDSQYSGAGGLSAFAEGSVYVIETSGSLQLISPVSYSSQATGETDREGIAVRSLTGSVQLTTINGDIVDGIKETFAAPTQAQIDALNDRMALFGAKALEAAQATIRNEENLQTEAYHGYWLNERNAVRQPPAASTLAIAAIDFATNTITTTGSHGLQSGAELHATSGQIGLTNGFTYFAVVVDATHIRIAPTRFDAAIAATNDPANPNSGRIVDLVAGVDFNASQLSSVRLDRFNYTADADSVVGSIAGIPDAWRIGSYNLDFVYEMPQAEQDAIIEARVRQATEVANPISATLRRFLYPESYIFNSATTGQSTELRNILAAEIRLNVADTNAAVNPPTGRVGSLAGIQTLRMENGINGVNGQASLLSEAQKQLLASAIVDDVIGLRYVTYRYLGNSATPAVSVAYNFQVPSHDFTNTSLWERVEPDYITSTQQAPFQIQTGETVLVEYNKTSYGWYTFVGTDQTVTLETQNFADTSLWQLLVANHETADTQLLDGEPLNTVKTVSLFFGNLVSDTTTVDRLTIQVVDDVNIQLIDEGSLLTLADGDIAIQADGDLRLSDLQTPGNVRLSSSGNMYDLGFGNAAVAALGTVNLEGQVVQSITVGEPLRVLVGPSGSLSGASSGNFNVVQGHGTFSIDGQSNSFGNLVVPRAFAGGTLSLDVTGGNLTIGKLESSTGFDLSATGSILDGDATSVQEEWNLYGPIASISSGGTIGVSGNPIDLRLSGNLDATASGSVFLKSELPLSLNNLNSGGSNVQIDVTGSLSVGRLIANDATTQITTTGSVLDGREVTTDHLPDGLSNITTGTLEIVAGTGSANTATIGTVSNPLEINTSVNAVGWLTAIADAGIFVAETSGDLNVTQVSSLTGVATLFSARSILESGSDVSADVLGSDILLYAGHGTSTGSIGSTSNTLEIDTNATTTLPASRLTAIAAGSIDLLEVSGSLNINDVHSTAIGDIVITLPDTALTGQNLVVDATARLLNDNGEVNLFVGDNATFQDGATLGASTEFNLIADHNDADVGTGVLVELLSNVASPVTHIDTADDEDSIHLVNLAANRYYVDGHGATDSYSVLLDGSTSERVSITDSGAGDDGADVLTVDGTSNSDLFLLRKYFLALLQPAVEPPEQDQLASTYERIDYDESINGRLLVRGGTGDDRFVTDDNSVITTLDGGEGADQFQIGQVFGVDPNSSVATGDEITTQQITHGYLSRGVSMPMVVYGGNGADQFTVFSNKAAIRLEGEGGNDTFLIRAFIIEGDTDVEGGEGDDYVEYNINAPVSINGGSGFDRVVAVGTEADDSFVLTDSGVFGAGLSVTVDGVEESVEVDGLEGNDSFYVLSTRAGVTYNIIGGLGSDTAILAGDVTQRIVASQTTGSSAVINHGSSSSTDIDYDGALMPGVGVTVAGSQTNAGSVLGAVVITESNGSTEVTEDVVSGIGAFDEYTIGMALDRNQFAERSFT